MNSTRVVKNRLPELRLKMNTGVRAVTGWTADKTVEWAKVFCPVSDNSDPGHVHMRDTIKAVWRNQYRKDAEVGADYGIYVNFGTIYTPPNPFWTMAHEQMLKEINQTRQIWRNHMK